MRLMITAALCIAPLVTFAEAKYENDKTRDYIRRLKADMDAGKLITVSAAKLSKEYRSNEVAADAKYKDKFLFVEGAVESVSKDISGNITVGLRSDNQFMPVVARFAKDVSLIDGLEGTGSKVVTAKTVSVQDAVTSIKRGSKVHVICRGAGYFVGSPQLSVCDILSK